MESIPPEIFPIIVKLTNIATAGRLICVNKLFSELIHYDDDIWEPLILSVCQTISSNIKINLISFRSRFNCWYEVAYYICSNSIKFTLWYYDEGWSITYFDDSKNEENFIKYLHQLVCRYRYQGKSLNSSSYILILEDKESNIVGHVLYSIFYIRSSFLCYIVPYFGTQGKVLYSDHMDE